MLNHHLARDTICTLFTNISEDTVSFISSITPPGYKFTHVPRNIKKGGGVGFFIKEDLIYEQVSKNNYQTFESISIQISSEGAKDVIFHVVYRPPNLSKSQFLSNLACSSKVLLYQAMKTFSLVILIFIWINMTPGH